MCIYIYIYTRIFARASRALDSPCHMTLSTTMSLSRPRAYTRRVPPHTEDAQCEHFKCRAEQPLEEAQRCDLRRLKMLATTTHAQQSDAPVRARMHTRTRSHEHTNSCTCAQAIAKRETQIYTSASTHR